MGKFSEEMKKAGVLETRDGLHPIEKGARVDFASGKPKLTDRPGVKAKEVVGGFRILYVKSREEALSWAECVSAEKGNVIEVREIYDASRWPNGSVWLGNRRRKSGHHKSLGRWSSLPRSVPPVRGGWLRPP